MKRIIMVSLLTASLTGASAQSSAAIDSLFGELQKTARLHLRKTERNNGNKLTFTLHAFVNCSEICSEETCGGARPSLMPAETDVEQVNQSIRKKQAHTLSVIRRTLDSISAQPGVEESYHFESHRQGIDTVRYAICLKNGSLQNKYYDKQRGYFYGKTPGTETLSFYYTAKLAPCGKHFVDDGFLAYDRTEARPHNGMPLDWPHYLQSIMPALKQRGIKRRDFKWTWDKSFDASTDDDKYIYKIKVDTEEDSPLESETSGSLYFIPRDKEELAQAVRASIDAATLAYMKEHPEQIYEYNYDIDYPDVVTPSPDKSAFVQCLFNSENYKGLRDFVFYHLFVGSDPNGYYILACETKGNMKLPAEWPLLKTIVNGKKTYHKGLKP